MPLKILKLLSQIKQNDLANDVPSISAEVGQFLHDLIIKNELKSALEIGCAHGYSSLWLASALAKNQGKLVTLDHSTPSFAIAQENVKASELNNIEMHFGRAQDIIPDLTERFDFIFIDGIKKSTLEFFELVTPKLASGGVIVVDDVLKFRSKMEVFWSFIETQSEWQYEVHKLDHDDGIMVIKRN